MTKLFERKEVAHAGIFGKKIAKLVKVLDIREATMLLFAYRLYPEEIENEYELIAKAAYEERIEDIFGLLDWYRYKELHDTAGIGDRGLKPKEELSIFQKTTKP